MVSWICDCPSPNSASGFYSRKFRRIIDVVDPVWSSAEKTGNTYCKSFDISKPLLVSYSVILWIFVYDQKIVLWNVKDGVWNTDELQHPSIKLSYLCYNIHNRISMSFIGLSIGYLSQLVQIFTIDYSPTQPGSGGPADPANILKERDRPCGMS